MFVHIFKKAKHVSFFEEREAQLEENQEASPDLISTL